MPPSFLTTIIEDPKAPEPAPEKKKRGRPSKGSNPKKTVSPPRIKIEDTIELDPEFLERTLGDMVEASGFIGFKEDLEKDASCRRNLAKIQKKYEKKLAGAYLLETVTCYQVGRLVLNNRPKKVKIKEKLLPGGETPVKPSMLG